MVTGENPHPHAPTDDPRVKEQLERLFGASLFGPWPELRQRVSTVQPRTFGAGLKRWAMRAAIWGASGFVAFGAYTLFRPGLQRTAETQRSNVAEELRVFVNDGNLERASEFVAILRDADPDPAKSGPDNARPLHADRPLVPSDPHFELILASEATLYRYFDADPTRVRLIRPFLSEAEALPPLRQQAVLTLLSREERAARMAQLERLRDQLPTRSEPAYLLASGLESNPEIAKTRAAWLRAEELGPAWLGQRFEQAWFELRHADDSAARKLAIQIVRFEPASAWAKLAISTFGLDGPSVSAAGLTDAAAPRVTPVQTHFECLVASIRAAKQNQQHRAKEQLLMAVAAVHDEAPFLLDAFDWLLAEELSSLAVTLTEQPGWPSGSEAAAGKLRRLSAVLKAPSDAAARTEPTQKESTRTERIAPPGPAKKTRRSTKKK